MDSQRSILQMKTRHPRKFSSDVSFCPNANKSIEKQPGFGHLGHRCGIVLGQAVGLAEPNAVRTQMNPASRLGSLYFLRLSYTSFDQ